MFIKNDALMKNKSSLKRKLEVLRIELFSFTYWIPNALPGYYFSNKVRSFILRPFLKHLGDNVSINRGIVFEGVDKISIGNNVQINTRCWISGSGELEIGENVLIGPHVIIHTANHNFNKKTIPILLQGHTFNKVIIEDNVWIGANCTILPGVTIKKGSVAAAGAVVTKDTIENGVYGGVPARLIKYRN